MLLMNLETRAVMFEDIARQVLNTGVRHQPEYWAEKIGMAKLLTRRDFPHATVFYGLSLMN